jgi:hypothetical protein
MKLEGIGKLQSLLELSPHQEIGQVPILDEDSLYVFLLQTEWKTMARKALEDNIGVFMEAIKGNALINVKDPSLRDNLIEMLEVEASAAPLLMLTPIHPRNWGPDLTDDKAIQIRLGYLSGYEEVVKYLQKISEIIGFSGKGATRKLSWDQKVEKIKGISTKIPIYNIVGLDLS